jgi:hypothetical protein
MEHNLFLDYVRLILISTSDMYKKMTKKRPILQLSNKNKIIVELTIVEHPNSRLFKKEYKKNFFLFFFLCCSLSVPLSHIFIKKNSTEKFFRKRRFKIQYLINMIFFLIHLMFKANN